MLARLHAATTVSVSSARSLSDSVAESLAGCVRTVSRSFAAETRLQVHGCQVLLTPAVIAAEDDRVGVEFLHDTVQEHLAEQLAQLDASSGGQVGADDVGVGGQRVPFVGAVVDRVAVGPSLAFTAAGIQTTLFYSTTRVDAGGGDGSASRVRWTPFHVPRATGAEPKANAGSRRTKSVGRWPANQVGTTAALDGEAQLKWMREWTPTSAGSQRPDWFASSTASDLPQALLDIANDAPPRFLLYTDSEPFGAMDLLDRHFPKSPKLGCVGAWTPFQTGRPFTLFIQDQIVDSGAVGVALQHSTSPMDPVSPVYLDLEPLGSVMTVTKCQGNIILEVDGGENPTSKLMQLLNSNETSDCYVLFADGDPTQQPRMARRVSSGNPSRGHMAIEHWRSSIEPGQRIQFARRLPANADWSQRLDTIRNQLTSPAAMFASYKQPPSGGEEIAAGLHDSNVFGAMSESGLIVGRCSTQSGLTDMERQAYCLVPQFTNL